MSDAPTREHATWKAPFQRLAAELGRNFQLRRELATLEVAHDRQLLLRGAIMGGLGVLFAIVGLTQLVQSLAGYLAGVTTMGVIAWSLIIGITLLVPGLLVVAFVYRNLRTHFCGLQGTLAELQEDLVWLREWAGSEEMDE
jgi:uncharacterized membrane protein YqjE